MVSTLILTHGRLASELLEAAETIVGELPEDFAALTLEWDDSFEVALEALGSANGILILTDMYGGTPYNVAASLRAEGRVEVVTGVNLPMVVRLGCPGATEKDVEVLAEWIQSKARGSICLAGEGNGNTRERDSGCGDD